MPNCGLKHQVQASKLVNSNRKLGQLADLLNVNVRTIKLVAIFKTSVDGWNPTKFHTCCDNKGPTLTLVQGPGGSYYGGYTSTSWGSNGNCGSDAQAFLFRCHSPATQSPEKFARSGYGCEIFNSPSYGPTFGYLHDFFTFDSSGGEVFRQQNYGGSPSFTLSGSLINDSATKTKANYQLEVLQVETLDRSTGELPEPWLAATDWTPQARCWMTTSCCLLH